MKPQSVESRSRPGISGGHVHDAVHDAVSPALSLPTGMARTGPIGLPELSEVDVVRHFTAASGASHGVDVGPYRLGSCTMKYNPKRNDRLAVLDGFRHVHPLQPGDSTPGLWEMMAELQEALAEITGMDAVTLQPAAGAHGELTGLFVIRRHFERRGERRTTILTPDSAHGTNPASAAMAGFRCRMVPTRPDGLLDVAALAKLVDDDVAAMMLTNPSTFGLFEEQILEISDLVHGRGGLLYYDGANLNALMGLVRPGDMGFDVMQVNLHKTFSAPHGGGGPGAGPCGVKAFLEPYLPRPVIRRVNGRAVADDDRPESIGKVKAHAGHVEVLVKALAYVLTCGPAGLRRASEDAVLNANYVRARLEDLLPPIFAKRCMHECLLGGGSLTISPFDFVKRLIDLGVHPPSLVGAGCVHMPDRYTAGMLVEPTESESLASLDFMIEQFRRVAKEAATAPYMIETAPHTTRVAKVIKDEEAYLMRVEATP
jgi:glycine dehydrogenase subunit 2